MKYENHGETRWQCRDELSDPIFNEGDATKKCDENPSCRYIENIDCLGEEFKLCRYLKTSSKSCVLQRTESRFDNVPYEDYKIGEETTWEYQAPFSYHRSFEEAVSTCNQSPLCKFVENGDCSGEGYAICKFLKRDRKSCAFEKKGNITLNLIFMGYIKI